MSNLVVHKISVQCLPPSEYRLFKRQFYCEHVNTSFETIENTQDYEYNQAIGNTSFGLHQFTREYCDDCPAWQDNDGEGWQDE